MTRTTDVRRTGAHMATLRPQSSMPRLIWGVLLVSVGIALLVAPHVNVLQISVWRLWPLFLIVSGIGKMTSSLPRRRREGGPCMASI